MTLFRKYWNVALSIAISLAVLLFGIIKNHSKTESTRDAALALLISLLITFVHRLTTYQQLLEESKDVVGKFIQLLSKNSKINDTVNHSFEAHKKTHVFNSFFLDGIFEEFNRHLQSLSHGNYSCNAEAELTVTTTILKCCNKCLKAVSFQDEAWWSSNNGTLYLDSHEKHIDRKKEKATRIFILDSNTAETLKPIFRKHRQLKIETYILYTDRDQIDEKYKVDFVIYDDFMLRRASAVKNIDGGKNAHFTTDESEVKKYSALFEQLLTIAKSRNNIIPE